MEKILSVIVPVYNVEQYIGACLDSFLDGPMDRIEVLIIDDGSTDRCPEIIRTYIDTYPETFRLIRKENGGHGSALNTGIREATGRYIRTVDGDDQVIGSALKELVDYLETATEDIVCTHYVWFQSAGGRERVRQDKTLSKVSFGKTYTFDQLDHDIFVKMHSMTCKTQIMRQVPVPIDEHCYYVDSEYVIYPIPFAQTICFLDLTLYRYRIGRAGQSINIDQMARNKDQHMLVLNRLLQYYDWARGHHLGKGQDAYIRHGISLIMKSQYKVFLSADYTPALKKEFIQWDHSMRRDYDPIMKEVKSLAVRGITCCNYLFFHAANRSFKVLYTVFYR